MPAVGILHRERGHSRTLCLVLGSWSDTKVWSTAVSDNSRAMTTKQAKQKKRMHRGKLQVTDVSPGQARCVLMCTLAAATVIFACFAMLARRKPDGASLLQHAHHGYLPWHHKLGLEPNTIMVVDHDTSLRIATNAPS